MTLFSSDYRVLFFLTALLIYAFIGAPTADYPGIVEGVIAALLFFALGVIAFAMPFRFDPTHQKQYWFLFAQILLLFGLFVPLIRGVLNDFRNADILRDLIGFLFLLLPIFIVPFIQKRKIENLFIMFCVSIGLFFGLRTLFPDIIFNIRGNELLYLANSPLVLFTAIYLLGVSGQKLFEKVTLRHFLISILAFIGMVVCMLAMMQDIRRAAFASLIVSLFLFLIMGAIKNPSKMLLPFCVIGAVFCLFYQDIFNIINEVSLKTSRVGMNMRVQEWQAIWQTVSANPNSLFFGYGWGASFISPAVGGLSVTFTHSLLSSMLLKTGLIGLLLCLFYLSFIFENLSRLVFSIPITFTALFWPFVVSILFYASYKSLDFGLLLTLILIWNFDKDKRAPDLS